MADYTVYISAAYAVAGLVIGALIYFLWRDYQQVQQTLARLEAQMHEQHRECGDG
jgi:heme exporter protein CcmD